MHNAPMLRLGGSLVLCLGLASCNLIFGIEEGELSATSGAPGGGGTGGTAGGLQNGGGGAGAGGAAGGGGTGGSSCEDGTACYTGDPANLVPGALCKQGTWGNCATTPTCVGEVLPASEDFATPGDEDCDGKARGDFVFVRELDSGMASTALYPAPGGGVVLVSTSVFLNLDDEPGDEIGQNNDASPFIARYDTAGALMWAYHMNDPKDSATEEKVIRVVVEEDRVLAFFAPNPGSLPGATFGNGGELSIVGNGLVVVSVDNTGSAAIEKYIPATINQFGEPPNVLAAVRLANGQYLFGGLLAQGMSISLEGNTLSSGSASSGDAFLIALNPDLSPAWGRLYTEPAGFPGGQQLIDGLATDGGNAYVGGSSVSTQMLAGALGTVSGGNWLLQLDSAGTETWIARGHSSPALLASNSGLVSCGYHAGPSVTPGQGVAVNLSSATGGLIWGLRPNGLHDWAQEYQLPGLMPFQYQCSLARGNADGVLGALSFRGTADLASTPLNSQGFSDVALFSLTDTGAVDYVRQLPLPGAQDNVAIARDLQTGRLWTIFDNDSTIDLGLGPIQPDNPLGRCSVLAQFEP